MFYIICSLAHNQGLVNLIGGDTINYTMGLGCWVVGIFAAVFLFYTNSFLMKRRKKEFGLFNILGMEKKHLSKVIAVETLYIVLISLTAGIGLGIVLDKAMYLLIVRWMGGSIPLGFYISRVSIVTTLILFAAIFFLIFLNSLRQIHLAKPIELLRGGSVGEKEPKTKWIMAILGVACLAGGYIIAVVSENPMVAVFSFFIAVILVIVGTYLLFTAGSIALLKLLRKNKGYYYKPTHFTSISGLIYRMKQNAVGLANICILSTMVLVMLASTSSMMIGMEDMVRTRYPYDIMVYTRKNSDAQQEAVRQEAEEIVASRDVAMTDSVSYVYLNFSAVRQGDIFRTDQEATAADLNNICNLVFVPLADYNRTAGTDYQLADGEVLLYSNRSKLPADSFTLFGRQYTVAGRLPDLLANGAIASNAADTHFMVVKDMEEIQRLYGEQKQAYGDNASPVRFCYGFNMDGDITAQLSVYQDMQARLNGEARNYTIESRADSRTGFTAIYGGLFFIGIFLGSLFIMATILIIYYKQISEGYDDKERFAIMQKVGMSHGEVKRSIHSQIMTVFFLPLLMAGVHVAFAFPIISRILLALNLSNLSLFVWCTVGCFLVFTLVYSLIYAITAKAYYRIVSR